MTLSRSSVAAVNPWQAHTATIRKRISEAPGVTTYYVAFADGAAPAFRPGQFGMLYLPGVGESPIGICGDPGEKGEWRFTVREAGNTTRGLAVLGVGETFGVRGPFGSCWPLDECRKTDIVIAAGGLGLPPLRPVIYEYLRRRDQFGRMMLLYGSRTPDALIYAGEYESWTRQGIEVHTTVDRADLGWTGNVGVVPQLFDRLASLAPERTAVFTCGPEVMMQFVIRAAVKRGVPVEKIWISMERNMQCAIGLCGHCQFGPEFICKDGPVFRYDRVAPLLSVEAL